MICIPVYTSDYAVNVNVCIRSLKCRSPSANTLHSLFGSVISLFLYEVLLVRKPGRFGSYPECKAAVESIALTNASIVADGWSGSQR